LACHLQISADPDPAYHFDADPNPAYHVDADPDPDPTFQFDADSDPDPQHCSKLLTVSNLKGANKQLKIVGYCIGK
jgi:hypothetical protein